MKKLSLLCAIMFLLVVGIYGQSTNLVDTNDEKTKFVKIPQGVGLILLASQPECPLKIEKADVFVKADGNYPIIIYSLRNTSSKIIRYFSIEFHTKHLVKQWVRYGVSGEDAIGRKDGNSSFVLSPNELYENISYKNFEVVPMTKEVEELLSLKDKNLGMKAIWIGLVTKIVFDDGTVYEAGKISENLGNFLYPE